MLLRYITDIIVLSVVAITAGTYLPLGVAVVLSLFWAFVVYRYGFVTRSRRSLG